MVRSISNNIEIGLNIENIITLGIKGMKLLIKGSFLFLFILVNNRNDLTLYTNLLIYLLLVNSKHWLFLQKITTR